MHCSPWGHKRSDNLATEQQQQHLMDRLLAPFLLWNVLFVFSEEEATE